MATNKSFGHWLPYGLGLIALIIAGCFVILFKHIPAQTVEISLSPLSQSNGTIYLEGAVINPGLYPFTGDDTIDSLLQAAGGTKYSANLDALRLYVTPSGAAGPQRIDINRADTWLLEALPGIGNILARRIVEYRQQTGPFRNTAELLEVAGMGTKTYEQLKDLVTVGD